MSTELYSKDHNMRKLLSGLCAIGLMAISFTGCSGQNATNNTVVVKEYEDGLKVIIDASPHTNSDVETGSAAVEISGKLTKGTEGCLSVENKSEGRLTVVTLPQMAMLSGELPLTLTLDNQRSSLGDEISFGGGYVSSASMKENVSNFPEECLGDEIFIVHASED